MIRINLLPVRQVRKAKAGQRQLIVFALLILAQVVAMFALYEVKASEVAKRQRTKKLLENDIAQLKKEVGDYDRLKKSADRLKKQKNTILQLQKARSGPVRVLYELSNILSVGKGPTYERGQRAGKGVNMDWNPRRVWVDRVDEKRKVVSMQGRAKDHDDVAELLRRLAASRYFHNVQLRRNELVNAKEGRLVKFKLTTSVRY